MFIAGFLLGLFVGGLIGALAVCLAVAADGEVRDSEPWRHKPCPLCGSRTCDH